VSGRIGDEAFALSRHAGHADEQGARLAKARIDFNRGQLGIAQQLDWSQMGGGEQTFK
jgi:hypothetical protein